ncbi:DUF6884 domain-containing protein [Clostridium sp.]|jgi:hypothetical protein|uniref:DUF6884 domain-containing protein n=1 Tax=Clostridium sp. TaxID=1506 RepID=UPI003EEF0632
MINIISSCTNSKKQTPSKSLQIENFNDDMDLEDIIRIWNSNIKAKGRTAFKATELYKGGSWQATLDTKEKLFIKYKTELFIASAGYGLIHAEEKILPYDSTFASSTKNSINKFKNNSKLKANIRWWNSINTFPITSFSHEAYFFVILPHSYLIAAQDMIESLIKMFTDKVFIFIANNHSLPPSMQKNIIKFDSRFNSFQAGVVSNMLQRAVLWLSTEIVTKDIPLSHTILQDHIEKEMFKYKIYVMPIRTKLTEQELYEKIKIMILENHISSPSKGLRLFRDMGYACEQKRFGKLFKEVKGILK